MGRAVFSPLFDLRPNYGGGNEDNGDLLQKVHGGTAALSAPDPAAGHCQPTPLQTHASPGDSWTLTGKSGSVSLGSLLLSPGSWCTQCSVVPSKSLFPCSVLDYVKVIMLKVVYLDSSLSTVIELCNL